MKRFSGMSATSSGNFADYYNSARVHYTLNGLTPRETSSGTVDAPINLKTFRWKSSCSAIFCPVCGLTIDLQSHRLKVHVAVFTRPLVPPVDPVLHL